MPGSVCRTRQLGGALRKAPRLCCGCSRQRTRKVTARDNSALGSSLVNPPQALLQPAPRLALGGSRSLPPRREAGKGDKDATAPAQVSRGSFCSSLEPGAGWLGTEQQLQALTSAPGEQLLVLSRPLLLSRLSLAWRCVYISFPTAASAPRGSSSTSRVGLAARCGTRRELVHV